MNYQPDLFAGVGIERSAANRSQNLTAAKAEMMATNSDTLFDAMNEAGDDAPAATNHPIQMHPCAACGQHHIYEEPDHDHQEPTPAYPDPLTGQATPLDDPRRTARMPSNKWTDAFGVRHTGVGQIGLYHKAACGYVGMRVLLTPPTKDCGSC